MVKNLIKLFLATILAIGLISCASTSTVENDIASLTKYNDLMFWEIDGTDAEGKDSTVYVLGTIHVGDDRLYPLPLNVEEALKTSDRIVGELSTEDWNNMVPQMISRQINSGKKEFNRVSNGGTPLKEYFSEEEIDFLNKSFGNPTMVESLLNFEPWILNSTLAVFPIQLSGLSADKGLDNNIIYTCKSMDRNIEGLDTLDIQFAVMEFGDWDVQLDILKTSLDGIINTPEEVGGYLVDMYEAYLSGDEERLAKVIESEDENSDAEYMDEYYQTLFLDRNKAWAVKFDDYLKKGGTTFIFAGCGHFVGKDSVFNIMKENNTLR